MRALTKASIRLTSSASPSEESDELDTEIAPSSAVGARSSPSTSGSGSHHPLSAIAALGAGARAKARGAATWRKVARRIPDPVSIKFR